MSVDMTIAWRDEKSQSYPVAAAGVFYKYWVPTAVNLGLETIPKFEGWLQLFTFEEVATVVEELTAFKNYLVASRDLDIPADKQSQMIERADKLTLMLNNALDEWDKVDYVGFG